jgi:hypothetical protein
MPTATPSVLVFDVNETLVDIDSLTPLFGEWFGDAGCSANGSLSSSCTR